MRDYHELPVNLLRTRDFPILQASCEVQVSLSLSLLHLWLVLFVELLMAIGQEVISLEVRNVPLTYQVDPVLRV